MQVTPEKLKAQQLVLFHLGFYKGVIDGIWSTGCIEAKQKFEADRSFLPAYPNGGLPFGDRDKLPKGMVYDTKGLIGHRDLTPERAKEILDATDARMKAHGTVDGPTARVNVDAERVPQPTPDNTEYAGDVTNTLTTDVAEPTMEQKPHQSQHDQASMSIKSNPAGPTGEANKARVQNQQHNKHKGRN